MRKYRPSQGQRGALEHFARLVKQSGGSRCEIADVLGISPSTLSNMMTGKRHIKPEYLAGLYKIALYNGFTQYLALDAFLPEGVDFDYYAEFMRHISQFRSKELGFEIDVPYHLADALIRSTIPLVNHEMTAGIRNRVETMEAELAANSASINTMNSCLENISERAINSEENS